MPGPQPAPRIAIACGGTGGHLFPGVAVARQLQQHGCIVTLLISPKDIDQHAVKSATGLATAILPAVGLTRGGRLAFVRGFVRSFRAARKLFTTERPDAVLAMGGFTSAPPVLAGRLAGIPVFLHESNTIPGRANRWLARFVRQAFVGFPEAAPRLRARNVKVTGTPVRTEFKPDDASACRAALGLDPQRPMLLVTGGSQGAAGLNRLLIETLPLLVKSLPELQLFHLTGPDDAEQVAAACRALGVKAVVHPFFAEMHLALGAASAAISRAGASSLAELAAAQVPAVLVPYPAATDNHQYYNALAFQKTGAARLVEQSQATPAMLAPMIVELIQAADTRDKLRAALAGWHTPRAAGEIAESILQALPARRRASGSVTVAPTAPNLHHHQSPYREPIHPRTPCRRARWKPGNDA